MEIISFRVWFLSSQNLKFSGNDERFKVIFYWLYIFNSPCLTCNLIVHIHFTFGNYIFELNLRDYFFVGNFLCMTSLARILMQCGVQEARLDFLMLFLILVGKGFPSFIIKYDASCGLFLRCCREVFFYP